MKLAGFVDKIEKSSTEKGDKYQVTIKLKKEKHDKETENLIEGTGNPWFTLKITTDEESNLASFAGAEVGPEMSRVVVDVQMNKVK